ncbi:methionyl-tRNA formyltransferase, partial [Micrococcus sp. HG099]|nr:methionyl-tRNA formyltransferase [Micrococcus sp. HG099]
MTATTPLRVLYAGTPETAVPVLRALLDSPHEVVGVLTRPDAPIGRRRVLTPSPVAVVAEEAGVPVVKADRLRGPAGEPALEAVRALEPDVAVVVAYGALVPAEALALPRHGWLNLHFSALPAYRGAAPVQRAVMAGEPEIAADVFQLEEGLD